MSSGLQGRSVVVTRARAQARSLAGLLESYGAEPLFFPTIALLDPPDWTPADAAIGALREYDYCVFTSSNAVDRFMDRLAAHHLDARAACDVRVVAVGPATAERLVERGLHPDLIPGDYRAEGVVDAILDEGIGAGTTVLVPRALEAREVLPESLEAAGATVDVVPVYRNVIGPGDAAVLERLEAGTVDAVTFTSSSTVRNMVKLLEEAEALDALKGVVVASIGPVTSATARELGLHVGVEPGEYTVPSLVRALDEAF